MTATNIGVSTATGTTKRRRLANRRASTTFSFKCNDLDYAATVSH